MQGSDGLEKINSWALSVIVCAVIVSIAGMLPKSRGTEKTVRTVLGAFMLCAVILPFGGELAFAGDTIREISIPPLEENHDIENAGKRLTEKRIRGLIISRLAQRSIVPGDVRVRLSSDEGGSISSVSAEIFFSRTDRSKAETAAEYIRTALGIECKAVIGE